MSGTDNGVYGSVIPGQDTWSESAMVLYFDEALRNGFSFRISRFPERNATWVWCHVIHDGALYCYTEHRLPCASHRIDPDVTHAIYDVPNRDASITRGGSSQALTVLSFSARVLSSKGEGGVEGPGDVQVALEGRFRPRHLRSGSPTGRFERTGEVEATLTVNGKAVSLSGLAKAHEQTQTRPRFNNPFTYTMLWGQDASLVALMARDRRYGSYEDGDRDYPIESFGITQRSPQRSFSASFDAGRRRITGTAETIYKYKVPVFERMWRGHVVAAQVEGRRLVGMINDWRSEDQIYEASVS
jgi:hypothetical protein